jgi:tetratricopeptide (TPR) repeat protein
MSPDQAGTAARRARREAGAAAAPVGRPPGNGAAPTASAPAAAPGPTSGRRGGALDPDALAALEEERAFLLSSLDDLEREHDAGDVDDVDYVALKDDYTARAATVIRAIEQRQEAFARARRPRRTGRVVAWVALLLVGSVALGVFVAQSSGRRDAGEAVTGDIRLTSRDLLLDARVAMGDQRLMEAIEIYDQVLADQPANTEALTYKGWLLYLTARQATTAEDQQLLLDRSADLLEDAVASDPEAGDARIFRARVLTTLGRHEEALADLDAVPEGSIPPGMAETVQGLRDEIEATLSGSSTTAPTTSSPPPSSP